MMMMTMQQAAGIFAAGTNSVCHFISAQTLLTEFLLNLFFCCSCSLLLLFLVPSKDVAALVVQSHQMTVLNLLDIVWKCAVYVFLSCFMSTGRNSVRRQSESSPALNGAHKKITVSRHTSADTHWSFQENETLHWLSHFFLLHNMQQKTRNIAHFLSKGSIL